MSSAGTYGYWACNNCLHEIYYEGSSGYYMHWPAFDGVNGFYCFPECWEPGAKKFYATPYKHGQEKENKGE